METHAQRSIRHCLEMLAPFEASDSQMAEAQQQFYHFMVSIYQAMYQDPEAYNVFPGPYEEYIRKRRQQEPKQKKEKEHTNDSRESTLRNTFQQAIQFYALYFYQLGQRSMDIDGQTGRLTLSREEYANALGHMDRIHEAKYNPERYEVLSKLGVQISETNDTIVISHKVYPQAMAGLRYLCQAPESKYKWTNYLRLDYKNAYAPIPTVQDIAKTLSPQSAEVIKRLEDSLTGFKIKAKIKPLRGIVSDFKWKVEYSCRGQNICGFYADREYLMLCIYFNDFRNINEFARTLQEEDDELFQWYKAQFPERLCKCPSNRRVRFGEEYRRICGLSNRAEIVNPKEEDVEKALFLMKKYRHLNV